MQAQTDDLTTLLEIQQIDLDILRERKTLEELPQREIIMECRQKRETIAAKQGQVSALKKDTMRKLTRITDEDASLAKKEQGVQAAIEAAHGDFRHAEARTKELAGIAKRRATLAEEHDRIAGELDKIKALEAQVQQILDDVDAREEQATATFKEQGGRCKMRIAEWERQRQSLGATVDPAVFEIYEKTASRTGGVAIGRLDDSRCGICRSSISGGRLIDLKAQVPLGICPSCQRLLIIE